MFNYAELQIQTAFFKQMHNDTTVNDPNKPQL